MDNFEQRLAALEAWRIMVDVSLGKNEVDRDYVKKEFENLKEELKEIKNTAKKLNLTIWGAVIVILVKFALSGQLSSVL